MPSLELEQELSALYKQKSHWDLMEPEEGEVRPGAESTIAKCLALRLLELPVGEFVEKASEKELPIGDIGKELLRSNIEDEVKHDITLQRIVDCHPKLGVDTYETEVNEFLQEFLSLDDHPISTARVIEISIFFIALPLLRFFGNTATLQGQKEITKDERIHTAANYAICNSLGIKYSKKADRLRREVVAWLVEDVESIVPSPNRPNTHNMVSFDYWLRQSTNLLTTGRAEELSATKRIPVPAFFELARPGQDSYKQ